MFFYAGAGVVHATLDAYPVDAQSSNFPRGTLALGYDGARTRPGRLGLRAVAAAHLSKPADPGVAGLTVRSHAVDYTVELGLPIRFTARDRR